MTNRGQTKDFSSNIEAMLYSWIMRCYSNAAVSFKEQIIWLLARFHNVSYTVAHVVFIVRKHVSS